MIKSIWGEEFDLEETPLKNKQLLEKLNNPKKFELTEKNLKSKTLPLQDRLNIININVEKILGKQKSNIIVIRDRQTLSDYISKAIKFGRIAIDTETNNSLDPLTCKLMGPCIYTKGEKQAYIPLHHVNNETGDLLPNQLTEKDIKEEFQRLIDNNTKIIMHNGKFDYKVIHCTCNIDLPIYWDTMIAARLLDENEPSAGLKQQYIDKIDPEQEKYDIEHLFENVEYAQVDPEIFAMYAATDALMTDKLYEWQVEAFKDPDLKNVYHVFKDVEMPLTIVVAKMELRGILLDKAYTERLSTKYHKLIDECNLKVQSELDKLKNKIDLWRLSKEANEKPKKKTGDGLGKSKNEQLADPISVDSPTQLSILLYDILGCPVVNKKAPRGTGVDELTSLAEKTKFPICNIILEKRELSKLLNTFIDKLPNDINISDGKIHGSFNQLGTSTGRFSSSGPNYQQLPRDVKSVRLMLTADPGKVLVGSDFSAQEVRMGAYASQDQSMIGAYNEGKDLYALIASAAFDMPYEQCLEFYPEGTKIIYEGEEVITGKKTHTNLEGKKRRQNAKPICIGSLYQRGIPSIAEQIGKTKEETQEMMDKFYINFPRLKQWMDEQKEFVKTYGYVDNWNGRRRRLPDALLPKYSFTPKSQDDLSDFNPFLECENKIDESLINKYKLKLDKIKCRKDYELIQKEALFDGIEIHDNTAKIAQAERQSVNYPCQSGGADITKTAMINIDNDPELNALGFELLLTIHDEVIGQCPEENADKVAELLPQIMVKTAAECFAKHPENTPVSMKCDPTVEKSWYLSEVESAINSKFGKLLEEGLSKEEALKKVQDTYCELLSENIKSNLIGGKPLKVN